MRTITELILFGKELPKGRKQELEALLVGAFKDFVASKPKWDGRVWGSQAAIGRFLLHLVEVKQVVNESGAPDGIEPIGPWFDLSAEEQAFFAGALVNASQLYQEMAKPGRPLAGMKASISYSGV